VRKRLPFALLAAGLVLLSVPGQALGAATRYAVPDGVGIGMTCTSPSDACSLKHVLEDVVQTGDEVIVIPGVHDPGANGLFVKSGVSSLNIHGQDGQPRPDIRATTSGAFVFSTCPISTCAGDGTVLRHLAIENLGTGGALVVHGGAVGSPLTIDDVHAVAGSASLAILVFGQTAVRSEAVIRNTTARSSNPGANGAAIASQVDLTMRNVTAVASGTGADALIQSPNCNDGLGCVGSSSSTVINSILVGGPNGFDVRTTNSTNDCGICFGNALIDYSNYDSLAECTGCSSSPPGAAHNQTAAPLLVNPAAGDFHQQAGSPTVDAGINDPANGTTDPDGNSRMIGSATDIGAFEDGHPRVVTEPAANVGVSGATLRGSVNPVGFPTTWYFEWGPTTAYANRIPAADTSVGNGTAAQAVSQDLQGLAPGTTVHYRLVAANLFGPVAGGDQSFTTVVPFAFTGLRLKVRVLVVRRGRFIRVPITCPAGVTGSCVGRIRLVTASRVLVPRAGASARRKLTLGSARFSVPAGATKRTRLRLSKPARRLAAARRRIRVVATLTATANATTKTTRRRVLVRSPRR
jgi:hypothetical protein